ncbi:uncharacterized protein DS421_15g523380 [Arachis hypogaea]|nr:uncharacterized protein DS421_15g523380 [Arachis hypogaea]
MMLHLFIFHLLTNVHAMQPIMKKHKIIEMLHLFLSFQLHFCQNHRERNAFMNFQT